MGQRRDPGIPGQTPFGNLQGTIVPSRMCRAASPATKSMTTAKSEFSKSNVGKSVYPALQKRDGTVSSRTLGLAMPLLNLASRVRKKGVWRCTCQ